jgi:TRAP-type C4-dicarboxylate transport system permease small subunit
VALLTGILGRINDLIAKLAMALAMAIVAFTVLALFGGAATRYLTGTGYDWLMELPPMMMPWLVFLLLGVLLRSQTHISVDFLPPKLSWRGQKMLRLVCNSIAFGAAIVFFIAGIDAVALFQMLGQVTEMEIEFPIWYIYLSFPVGFAILASFAAEMVLRDLHDLLHPDHPLQQPGATP